MKYYGEWSCSNSYTAIPYEDEDPNKLMRLMIKLCYANSIGSTDILHWSVWSEDKHGNKIMFAEGGKPFMGRKWKEIYTR